MEAMGRPVQLAGPCEVPGGRAGNFGASLSVSLRPRPISSPPHLGRCRVGCIFSESAPGRPCDRFYPCAVAKTCPLFVRGQGSFRTFTRIPDLDGPPRPTCGDRSRTGSARPITRACVLRGRARRPEWILRDRERVCSVTSRARGGVTSQTWRECGRRGLLSCRRSLTSAHLRGVHRASCAASAGPVGRPGKPGRQSRVEGVR